jgi:acetyl-CoA C-acetyltransferase
MSPIDPRTPVLVGAGQISQRVDDGAPSLEPVDLMVEATRRAAADAGAPGLAAAPDSVRVMNLLSWQYRDPGALVAERLGAQPRHTAVTVMGGNYPQTVVNRAAVDLQAGRADVVVVCGAESWRSRSAARKDRDDLPWTVQDEAVAPDEVVGHDDLELSHPNEVARGLFLPIQHYPMFDVALRTSLGLTIDEHRDRIAALWSRFSEVAEQNPDAWIHQRYSPQEIREPSATNRMVGFPYTKLMNSNNQVEQGASLILCTAAAADAAGVPRDRWVFPLAGADAHDHWFVSHRADLCSSPAIRLCGRDVLTSTGSTIDDVAHIDLYSCFPSAVQISAAELGLALDQQLTVTGGMSFAGGPWNNYVSHSIATMARVLREDAGSLGMVTANGGFTTKHSIGLYSTTPGTSPYRHHSPQAEVDALPATTLVETVDGPATVESYTVVHGRDGRPETAFAACSVTSGAESGRAWARSEDADLMASMVDEDWVGRQVTLTPTGTMNG